MSAALSKAGLRRRLEALRGHDERRETAVSAASLAAEISSRAAGVTHVLTWRPPRSFLNEVTGLWGLYALADYLDDRGHCDLMLDHFHAGPDAPRDQLAGWAGSRLGFAVSLEEAATEAPAAAETELRLWVRRSS